MKDDYCVLWLFLTVLWVGLQYVIVVFPDHTHLLLGILEFIFNMKHNFSETSYFSVFKITVLFNY